MSLYLPLFPILLLVFTSLVMLVIRLARPGFAYLWLVAALGALLAWAMVLFTRTHIPQNLPLMTWLPAAFFPASPALLVDPVSWSYALALATLALAVILTDVLRAADADWVPWAGSLVVTALGLLAVLSGNLLTLLLAWTAIDLAELVILLVLVPQSSTREQIILAFGARLAGTVLVIGAGLVAISTGSALTFSTIPPQVVVYLLLAAGLRLGVLPMHTSFLAGRKLDLASQSPELGLPAPQSPELPPVPQSPELGLPSQSPELRSRRRNLQSCGVSCNLQSSRRN